MSLDSTLLAIIAAENVGHTFYRTYLLSSAMSGFLSISGFIFAMHSFVITKMKEGVYDSEHYGRRLQQAANQHKSPVPRYKNLKNLHTKLMACVYACLFTALSQLLFGYWAWAWLIAAAFCLIAIVSLISAIRAMKLNMTYLFEELDMINVQPESDETKS